MKFKNTILTTAASLSISAGGIAVAAPQEKYEADKNVGTTETSMMDKKNIVEIASAAEDFTTLVAAIEAADLVDALTGEGPYTVFAPTNAAFEALPEGALVELLKPENKGKLQTILKYHVLPGKVMAADVAPMEVASLEGRNITVGVDGEKVMVDGANVVKTDVEASNGVIHVIDAVLMPAETE